MKYVLSTVIAALGLAGTSAADTHEHHRKAGPNGGRVIELEGGHAEMFVQPDRKIRVTMLDEAFKAITPGEQRVSAVAEAPAGKTRLAFGVENGAFISQTALPAGDGYQIVLQIRAGISAKPQNTRINYRTEICGECKRPEYACTCGTGGETHAH